MAVLGRFPGLRICIAEGDPLAAAARRWPDATYVNGFPLAQYYNAFDFSIAAAGYNTFVDVISFGLPTIFVPNRHPSLDDQSGRARFAQDHAAAFDLSEQDLPDLEEIVKLILNQRARAYLRANCLKLAPANGAPDAARIVERLLLAEAQ
nr:glycosyltransferase [Rubellimicrobium arenae]